jgi:hypothetical protein
MSWKLIWYAPIILAPIVLFSESLFTGKVLYWGTPALQFIPWRYYAWEQISQGILPLWNPLNGMGVPFFANYQLALFYPPGWVAFLFAWFGKTEWMTWAHSLLLVMHIIWMGLGMMAFTKKLGYSDLGRVISSLSIALSGYFIARGSFFSMIWTASWIPWILFFLEYVVVKPIPIWSDWKKFTGLSVCLSMLLLAGHAQLAWYGLLFSFAWILMRIISKHGIRALLPHSLIMGSAFLLSVLLASIQLIPTFEFLTQSQRSSAVDYDIAMTFSFWHWRLLGLFLPDLFGNPGYGNYWGYASFWEDSIYIGMLPVIAGLGTFLWVFTNKDAVLKEKKTVLIFLWSILPIAFILALGINSPIFQFLYNNIPTFNMFQAPSRFMIWFVLSISLLAGLGVDNWRSPSGKSLYWTRLMTAGCFAITLGAIICRVLFKDVSTTFIRATSVAGFWSFVVGLLSLYKPKSNLLTRRNIWMGLVVCTALFDLLVAGWKLNPLTDNRIFSPQVYPQISTTRFHNTRIYISPEDEYLLKFRRFFRFSDYTPLEDPINIRKILLPNINMLDQVSMVNNFDPMVPYRYAKWMLFFQNLDYQGQTTILSKIGVMYQVSMDINKPIGISLAKITTDGEIYWSPCAVIVNGEEESFAQLNSDLPQKLLDQKYDPIIIENVDNQKLILGKAGDCLSNGKGVVDNLKRTTNSISFDFNSNQDGWVVVADTWYPGWVVKLDGLTTTNYHADYLFRGLYVPSGNHIIQYIYQPTSFRVGLWLTVFSGLGLLSGVLVAMKGTRKEINKDTKGV